MLNSSVNSYRRLDPHFEAPNQIKASAIDRGSMVRIPLGNERSARVEVRSIAPDANPYLAIYTLLKTGLEGPQSEEETDKRPRTRFLPDNIYDAIRLFKGSRFMQEAMGEEVHAKFAELKLTQAERCPKALGTLIKPPRCSSTTRSRISSSGRSSKRLVPAPRFLHGGRSLLPPPSGPLLWKVLRARRQSGARLYKSLAPIRKWNGPFRHTVYEEPSMPEEMTNPSGSPEKPRSAWSPTGIAIVSILLTPILGGVLHALNYKRLGAPARGRLALFSNLITGTVLLLFPSLPPGIRISASLFVASYFYKTQEELFLAHRSGGRRKASLAVPIFLTLVAALALLLVFFLVAGL